MPRAAQYHQSSRTPTSPPCRQYQHLYNYRWAQTSKAFLNEPAHRFCAHCKNEGRLVLSDVTDHIKPHRGDPQLFWDQSNWQGLCKRHHDRKTKAGG